MGLICFEVNNFNGSYIEIGNKIIKWLKIKGFTDGEFTITTPHSTTCVDLDEGKFIDYYSSDISDKEENQYEKAIYNANAVGLSKKLAIKNGELAEASKIYLMDYAGEKVRKVFVKYGI